MKTAEQWAQETIERIGGDLRNRDLLVKVIKDIQKDAREELSCKLKKAREALLDYLARHCF